MVANFLPVLHVFVTLLAFALCILCVFLLIECLAAMLPPRTPDAFKQLNSGTSDNRTTLDRLICTGIRTQAEVRLAIIMPAHNESAVIASTLTALLPQLKPEDKLVVIADNCTDDTAAIACAYGATVLERNDPFHRGKGYALAHGVKALSHTPPDVVIVIDADTSVAAGALEALAQQSHITGRPVQSEYRMVLPSADDNVSLMNRVTVFATRIRNIVRLRGLDRLNLPVILTGTGMAFPWSVISNINLASGNLVEDMKLGFDLTLAGHDPMLCSAASVTAPLPQNQGAVTSQRTRWEHGRFAITQQYFPRLVAAAFQQKRLGPLVLAIDLCILPLSLLVVCVLTSTSLSLLLGWLSGTWLAAIAAGGAIASMTLAIMASWWKFGRQDLPARQFALIPPFILWKIPIYLKFFLKPEKAWVRTKRDRKFSPLPRAIQRAKNQRAKKRPKQAVASLNRQRR